MKQISEVNEQLSRVFEAMRKGYETGDFSEFFLFLSDDCVYESHWVLTPMVGKEKIVYHLTGKGEALIESGSFCDCTLVELIGNVNTVPCEKVNVNGKPAGPGRVGIHYTHGKYCLLIEQEVNGEHIEILIDLRLNDEGKVARIDLCDPVFFAFREVDDRA